MCRPPVFGGGGAAPLLTESTKHPDYLIHYWVNETIVVICWEESSFRTWSGADAPGDGRRLSVRHCSLTAVEILIQYGSCGPIRGEIVAIITVIETAAGWWSFGRSFTRDHHITRRDGVFGQCVYHLEVYRRSSSGWWSARCPPECHTAPETSSLPHRAAMKLASAHAPTHTHADIHSTG